jgi:RHS repeat-associated protein
MDANTGLIYFGQRYYDPDTARFISQDSYLGEPGTPPSLHRYLYAYSNPTVYIDLFGYAAEKSIFDKISDAIQEKYIDPLNKEADELSKKFKKGGVNFENNLKAGVNGALKAGAKFVKGSIEAFGVATDLIATSDPANGLFEEGEESRARVRQVVNNVKTAIVNAPAQIQKTIEDREGKLKELRAYLDKSFVQGDPKDTFQVVDGLVGLVLSTRGPGEFGAAGKAISEEVRVVGEIGKGAEEAAKVGKFVDLTDAQGRLHILAGDGPGKGGGHRFGTGKPNKSEFPANWSDDKILHEVSDIASDPNVRNWSKPDSRGYSTGTKTIDGVDIKVVLDTKNNRIVSGYPTNTPRNPR